MVQKKFLVTPFLKNGQVLYSSENKAYLKPLDIFILVLNEFEMEILFFKTVNSFHNFHDKQYFHEFNRPLAQLQKGREIPVSKDWIIR